MTGNREQAPKTRSSSTAANQQPQPTPATRKDDSPVLAPMATPAFDAARETPPGAGQPAVTRAAEPETPNPLSPSLPAGARISAGSRRGGRDAWQEPKDEDKQPAAAAVTVPLPAAPALPLRLQPFPAITGNREQAGETQSSWKAASRQPRPAPAIGEDASPVPAPVAVPALDAAQQTPPDTGQPAVTRAADADSAPETSHPPAPDHPPLAPAGELAFAARVRPSSTASAAPAISPRPMPHATAPLAQLSSKKTGEDEAADPTVVRPIAAGAGSSLNSYGHASANAETLAPPPAPASALPKPVEANLAAEIQPKPATAPLKEISIQVAQPGAEKVEVRVVQQSGELRVAVRTGDSDLAHGLQQGLSDLVGRLQESGFRSEAWRPGSTVQSTPVMEPRSSHAASQNGDSQPNSGGSHQQEGERRQGQSQRPAWVEELENSLDGAEPSQGAFYGIGS